MVVQSRSARILLLALCGLPSFGIADVLTNAVDVTRLRGIERLPDDARFDLTGTVVRLYPDHPNSFVIADETGSVRIDRNKDLARRALPLQRGDRLHIRGKMEKEANGLVIALENEECFLGRETPPPDPIPATARQILDYRVDCRVVRLRGTVQDARIDETDPNYTFLMIHSDGETVFTAFHRSPRHTNLSELIGAEIEVDAFVMPCPSTKRRFTTHELSATTNEIRVLVSAEELRRKAPPVTDLRGTVPTHFPACGPHCAQGTILAVYGINKALLRTDNGDTVILEDLPQPPPRVGQAVKAVGMPQTDLHFIHLTHARCSAVTNAFAGGSTVRDVRARDFAPAGIANQELHGQTVRLRGTVKLLPQQQPDERLFLLECDDRTFPVDLTTVDLSQTRLAVGCTVELTAVCVLSVENWLPGVTYSRVLGYTLVPRQASDIRILSYPPWWTPGRLLVLVGVLLVTLLGFFIWNRILRRLVERRSRELFRAELTSAKSRLRLEERTRLAVELHDSLAQDLTGISMEIEAARRCRDTNAATAFLHMDSAGMSLKSCRNELRNTLWDLRSQALEEAEIDKAIRQTLLPHIRGIELKVRFNVPRARLSDSTLHEILRIIRELVVNAIRHGQADRISIAGSMESGRLLFSVRDNGCGFDPCACPGPDEGHFGLAGIRERLCRLGGTLDLSSLRDRGTEARVSIRLNAPHKGPAS